MLHHNFKLELFKRYLQTNPARWQEIAIETFQNLLSSHYEYDILHQKYEEIKSNNINQINLSSFNQEIERGKTSALHNTPECKFILATQALEQLQVENQELRDLIRKAGLIIISFLPKMTEQMAAEFDALLDEMVEK